MEKEFILCAAIWINDKQKHEQQPDNIELGFVICGRMQVKMKKILF